MLKRVLSRLSLRLLAYWACLLIVLVLFVQLAGEVYEREGFFFDAPVLDWFAAHESPLLVGAARVLSAAGSPLTLGVLSAALALGLRLRRVRGELFLLVGFGGALLLNALFKLVFARGRPALFEHLTPAPGYAFPSGHAMGSAAFCLALYLVARRSFPRLRLLVGVLGTLFTLSVGLSRLALQVHYPSDVLAGGALSTAWVLGVNLVFAPPRGGVAKAASPSP